MKFATMKQLWKNKAGAALLVAFLGWSGCRSFSSAPQSLNIVFIGDSITYGCLLKQPEKEAPPAHAVAYLQGMPGILSVRFMNCGNGGSRIDSFLPERADSAWPQVKQAADAFTNETGKLIFSIMIGANDSNVCTPAQYGANLALLVKALVSSYPASHIVIHHPLWYTKVPSTHPEVLEYYIPVIDAVVGTFGKSHPGRVHLGNVKGWEYFKANHETVCFREQRDNLPYYVHPNEIGAAILGQYWGEAIRMAVGPYPIK